LNWPFLRYFFGYLFHAKTRQRLLFIAIFGLIISSFALLVLQSTMGGLQGKLIGRSKAVVGTGVFEFPNASEDEIKGFVTELSKVGAKPIKELEIELLVKYGQYYAPMIVHGLDPQGDLPDFLEGKTFEDLVLPRSLAIKINSTVGDLVRLLSPGHLDNLIGNVPRLASLYVDYLVNTEVPEIDDFHGWARLLRIQAIVGKKVVNKIRLYDDFDQEVLNTIAEKHAPHGWHFQRWEDVHATLVWALSLETAVFVFLFSAMTLLVSLAITSGLLIFFSKTKGDLASFWVMGTSERSLFQSSKIFLFCLTFFSVGLGILFGLVFLGLLDHFGPNIMPDVFVDRKIPVRITGIGVFLSFSIPFSISLIFAWQSLKSFRKDINYLTYIRSLGS
jgi:lipoprotein-releasing system permease protein